jgi:hypothetical protein
MAKSSSAYAALAHYLVARRRRDLLIPLAEAYATMAAIALLLEAAQRDADAAAATWLKAESLRQRAAFEHATFRIVEAVSEEPDGADLISTLLDGDDTRLLADILLDGE